jgi:hypothetical protein
MTQDKEGVKGEERAEGDDDPGPGRPGEKDPGNPEDGHRRPDHEATEQWTSEAYGEMRTFHGRESATNAASRAGDHPDRGH